MDGSTLPLASPLGHLRRSVVNDVLEPASRRRCCMSYVSLSMEQGTARGKGETGRVTWEGKVRPLHVHME